MVAAATAALACALAVFCAVALPGTSQQEALRTQASFQVDGQDFDKADVQLLARQFREALLSVAKGKASPAGLPPGVRSTAKNYLEAWAGDVNPTTVSVTERLGGWKEQGGVVYATVSNFVEMRNTSNLAGGSAGSDTWLLRLSASGGSLDIAAAQALDVENPPAPGPALAPGAGVWVVMLLACAVLVIVSVWVLRLRRNTRWWALLGLPLVVAAAAVSLLLLVPVEGDISLGTFDGTIHAGLLAMPAPGKYTLWSVSPAGSLDTAHTEYLAALRVFWILLAILAGILAVTLATWPRRSAAAKNSAVEKSAANKSAVTESARPTRAKSVGERAPSGTAA